MRAALIALLLSAALVLAAESPAPDVALRPAPCESCRGSGASTVDVVYPLGGGTFAERRPCKACAGTGLIVVFAGRSAPAPENDTAKKLKREIALSSAQNKVKALEAALAKAKKELADAEAAEAAAVAAEKTKATEKPKTPEPN